MAVLEQKEALSDTLVECARSTKVLAKTLLPEQFDAPFAPAIHDKIFELIDSSKYNKICILAPRGIGKTSITHAYIIRHILFRLKKFIVYVSNSLTVAEMQTENIKRSLQTTEEIRKLFGSIKISKHEDMDETFSKKAWSAYGYTFILPRGSGQQVRGLLQGSARPDLVVMDDFESAEGVMSEVQRMKDRDWFFGSLMKISSRVKRDCKFVYIDTLKHQDALPTYLEGLSDWKFLKLAICDEHLVSLAPEFMSNEEIKQEMESYKAAGQLDTFYQEMMNIPVGPESASFKSEHFQHYDEKEEGEYLDSLENIILVDPAKTVTPQSDDTAVVCVALDLIKNRIYYRQGINGKMYPDEMYDHIFALSDLYKARAIGLEVTSLNEFIVQPFKNEISSRGKLHIELIELKAKGSKLERIRSLISYYRNGGVFHNKACSGALEQQLMSFPRSKHDDLMDALAYAVSMMAQGERYFLHSGVKNQSEFEERIESLPKLKPLRNWRSV